MTTLRIRNWDKWQSYRKDRGQPPWIKVHRALMRDPNWVALSDAQRGQLVAMWMLAADRNGVIPASPAVVAKLCFMDNEPDINLFIEKDFIVGCHLDANMTPDRRQHDASEERRVEERRGEGVSIVSREKESGQPTKYVFECGVIKLVERDFESWKKAFKYIDISAELIGSADWAAQQPNWFNAVAGLLAKRNRTEKTKVDAPQNGGGVKWRSGREGVT